MASLRKRGKVWYYRRNRCRQGVKYEAMAAAPDRRPTDRWPGRAAENRRQGRQRAGSDRPERGRAPLHAARPLSAHLDDWHAHLIAKGATAKHAAASLNWGRRVAAMAEGAALSEIDPPATAKPAKRAEYAARLAERVGKLRLADLTRDRVQAALASLRAAGRSLATCNAHRTAIRGRFSRWACKELAGRMTTSLSGSTGSTPRRTAGTTGGRSGSTSCAASSPPPSPARPTGR